jgi:hypothetical protein
MIDTPTPTATATATATATSASDDVTNGTTPLEASTPPNVVATTDITSVTANTVTPDPTLAPVTHLSLLQDAEDTLAAVETRLISEGKRVEAFLVADYHRILANLENLLLSIKSKL